MKFAAVAVALVGTAAADPAAAKTTACIKGVKLYSDEACKTAIDTSKDAAAKTWAATAKTAFDKLCKDKKMTVSTTYPVDKCTKLAAAVGKVKSVMYFTKAAGSQALAAGAAAALAFAATQF